MLNEKMFVKVTNQLSRQCEEAGIKLDEATTFIHGNKVVAFGSFNEETQDDEEFFRNLIDAVINCCSDKGLYYAREKLEKEIEEMEKDFEERQKLIQSK